MIQLCGIFRDCDILNGNKPLFDGKQKKKDSNFEEIFKKECEKLKKEGEKDEICQHSAGCDEGSGSKECNWG